ncbi:MAG: hypothetical protein ACAH95_09525 [Fimbriimonas sp.]
MPSGPKKTVGRFVRLTEEADKALSDLKRKLSFERGEDLALGDVISEALQSLKERMDEPNRNA